MGKNAFHAEMSYAVRPIDRRMAGAAK